MPRKNVLLPVQIEDGKSMSVSFTTDPTVIMYSDNIAYQINVTTSNSIGTFAVQGSLDYKPNTPLTNPSQTGNWANLVLSGTPTVNAANDTILINLNQVPYNAVRLAYTSGTAGTGTCDIYVSTKEI